MSSQFLKGNVLSSWLIASCFNQSRSRTDRVSLWYIQVLSPDSLLRECVFSVSCETGKGSREGFL